MKSEQVDRFLDGNGVDFHKASVGKGEQSVVERDRLRCFACLDEGAKRLHLPRRDIRHDGDNPRAADGENGEVECVFARVQIALIAGQAQGLHGLAHVAACVLHAGDIRDLRNLRHGGRLNFHPRTPGYVVGDDGQGDRLANRLVVRDQTVLRAFVVVGGHGKQAVAAEFFRRFRRHDRVGGVVATATKNDFRAFVDLLHRVVHEDMFFLEGHGGGLARRAQKHDGVRPVCNLELDELSEYVVIYARFIERRDQRGGAAFKKSFHNIFYASYFVRC